MFLETEPRSPRRARVSSRQVQSLDTARFKDRSLEITEFLQSIVLSLDAGRRVFDTRQRDSAQRRHQRPTFSEHTHTRHDISFGARTLRRCFCLLLFEFFLELLFELFSFSFTSVRERVSSDVYLTVSTKTSRRTRARPPKVWSRVGHCRGQRERQVRESAAHAPKSRQRDVRYSLAAVFRRLFVQKRVLVHVDPRHRHSRYHRGLRHGRSPSKRSQRLTGY